MKNKSLFLLFTIFCYSTTMAMLPDSHLSLLEDSTQDHARYLTYQANQFLSHFPYEPIYQANVDFMHLSDDVAQKVVDLASENQLFFVRLINLPQDNITTILDYTFSEHPECKALFCPKPMAQGLIQYAYKQEKYNNDAQLRSLIGFEELYKTPTESLMTLYDALEHFKNQPFDNKSLDGAFVITPRQKQALAALPAEIRNAHCFNTQYFIVKKSLKQHGLALLNSMLRGYILMYVSPRLIARGIQKHHVPLGSSALMSLSTLFLSYQYYHYHTRMAINNFPCNSAFEKFMNNVTKAQTVITALPTPMIINNIREKPFIIPKECIPFLAIPYTVIAWINPPYRTLAELGQALPKPDLSSCDSIPIDQGPSDLFGYF